MTDGGWEVVGQEDWELPIGKTVGDALRGLIRKRWKNNAAKHLERAWDLDPRTARNVVTQGHVSERTLTKAARAESWGLWMALGEELFGQSYADWEDERLQRIIEEATHARGQVRGLRERSAAIRQGADSAFPALDREGPDARIRRAP
jgi:hypothetical protein